MARRVYHYSESGSYYSYYRENGEAPKTLCNREMTARYYHTDNPERVTCSRCLAKLEKNNMLPGQANGRTLRIEKVRDIGSCGDEAHDLYLQRLGIA